MQFLSFVLMHVFSVKSMQQRDPTNESPCVALGQNENLQTLIICEAPEGTRHASMIAAQRIHLLRPDLILIVKQSEDKQCLGMKLGKIHFITLYSNNSTPIDKLDVVLCLAKCYVGGRFKHG